MHSVGSDKTVDLPWVDGLREILETYFRQALHGISRRQNLLNPTPRILQRGDGAVPAINQGRCLPSVALRATRVIRSLPSHRFYVAPSAAAGQLLTGHAAASIYPRD
jgi:hypothetical protein